MPYSLTEILKTSDDDLLDLTLILQLDPNSSNLKREILEKLENRKELIHDYHFIFPKESFPISEIICEKLSNNRKCSPTSQKIADNLIKVGATRIFAEEEKSFIEPVVNAIDAYQIKSGKKPIGKFGIGFYSLLYWVIKYPKSYLKIYSNPIPGVDEEAFQPWEGLITSTSIEIKPAERRKDVRFRLELFTDISYEELSEKNPYEVIKSSLQDITTAEIILQYESFNDEIDVFYDFETLDKKLTIGKGEKIKVSVFQRINNLIFIVEDNALGLPIYNLENLLVPALSSKTIRSSIIQYIPIVGGLTMIGDFDESSILVGEIKLLNLKGSNSFKIQLSPQTPLPVSRDDILISNRLVKEEFEMNIFYLLDQSIEEDPGNLPFLLIETLKKYPTGKYLAPILEEKIIERGYLFVPRKYFDLYRQITDQKIIGSDDNLNIKTENLFIDENPPDFDLLAGRGVYFLDVPELTFANSTRLVFLPYDQVNDENLASWILLHQEHSLVPLGIEWKASDRILENIKPYMKDFYPRDLYQNLLGRIYGLRDRFEIKSVRKCLQKVSWFIQMLQKHNDEFLEQVIAGFLKVCGLYKPIEAYGILQKELLFNNPDVAINGFRIPVGWENSYLELFEKLIPLMVEEDVFFLADTQLLAFDNQLLKFKNKTQNIEEWLYLITFYRSYKLLFDERVDAMLDYWRTYLRSGQRINLLLRNLLYPKYRYNSRFYPMEQNLIPSMITKPSKNYYDLLKILSQQLSSIPLPPVLQRYDGGSYYLSKFLQNIFENKSSKKINNEIGTLPIQILEIAINEGTNKNPLEAMITETFQNSLDARRVTGNNDPIKINFGRNGSLLSYSISDAVGITLEGIIALSIPFLSNKTDPFSAGNIGSGFFIVYNRALVVNIITVKDGIETIIVDGPIRENDRVVDIRRTISERKNRSNGTTITIYFKSQEPEKELSMMLTYCQNILPLTTDHFYLNGKNIQIETHPLTGFSSELIDVRVGDGFESYVLTKGSPFATLANSNLSLGKDLEFLDKYVNSGLVINLKEGFEPTQSRSKIRIDYEEDYQRILQDMAYFYIFEKQLNNPGEDYIPNFTSTGNVWQILPPAYQDFPIISLDSFIWGHLSEGGRDILISFSEIVNSELDLILGKLTDLEDHIFSDIPEDDIRRVIARKWLEGKDLTKPKEAVDLEIVEGGGDFAFDTQTLEFAQRFAKAYAMSLGISTDGPKVGFAILEDRWGEYDRDSNIIRLSSKLEFTSPLEDFSIDNILGYLEDNFSIYGKRFPASIMIHELEHYRRGESHGIDTHGNVKIGGKDYTFDESANYHYELALKNNILKFL